MKDAIPEPGDRFAVRINLAGYQGNLGGGLGFSAAISDNLRLHVNYGQGETQTVVGAGLNFSFH